MNYVRYESMWYPKSCGRIFKLIEKFLFDIFCCESNSAFEWIVVIIICGI